MNTENVGFIGAGNMAGAIIRGIVRPNTFPAEQIMVFDVNTEKCEELGEIGVKVSASSMDLVQNCKVIFLAVKPQNFTDVLSSIKEAVNRDKVFVSIAAGISTSYIQKSLGCACPVIRAMPNTPLLLGKGATALCASEEVLEDTFALIRRFFEACGSVAVLSEEQMNAVISVNGSSPAYFYLFAKAMVESAEKQGISPEISLPLICQTMEGSAAMLRQSKLSPEELIRMVSSPGGTTLKALDVLYQKDLVSIVDEAMKACTQRAEELGQ